MLENILSDPTELLKCGLLFCRFISIRSALVCGPSEFYVGPGTGGKITRMIAAADKILSLAEEVAHGIENAARAVSK